jgi:biopolymer transport protein ExbB/TolQ
MTHSIDQAIFDVAKALEVPVLILALLALAAVIIELGAFAVEIQTRRRRRFGLLAQTARTAWDELARGEREEAANTLSRVGWSATMTRTLTVIADSAGLPGADTRIAKALADFDFEAERRLGRTRLLVRAGPALGLMGTLIPLSPALDGLANGKVNELSQNLRVAFSVTVLGLLVGAVAFGLSLYRDRLYGHDLSDLEYVAAVLTSDQPPVVPPPPPVVAAPAPAPVAAPAPVTAPAPAPTTTPAATSPTATPPPATPPPLPPAAPADGQPTDPTPTVALPPLAPPSQVTPPPLPEPTDR